MTKASKKLSVLMGGLMAGTLLLSTTAFAAAIPEYDLGNMVVTATRYEKKEVDVAASTVILTKEQIKNIGAKDAADALSKVNGFSYKTFAQGNASMGTMINEVTIRGIDNGTLILVNGNPVSWRGKYNLDAIPAENIERIEVVKGGGSVLYGSEAMAGVVNIITKKGGQGSSYITTGFGNYGQQNYGVGIADEKFNMHASFNKWGEVKDRTISDVNYTKTVVGTTTTNAKDIAKKDIGFDYKINNRLNVLYDYYKTEATYDRFINSVTTTKKGVEVGDEFNNRTYTTEAHMAQLLYKDDLWKGSLFVNHGTVESDGDTFISSSSVKHSLYNTKERNVTYGAEIQRNWDISNKSKAILGVNWEREKYEKLKTISTTTGSEYARNNWAVFGQWEQNFDNKNTVTVSARETWTSGAEGDQNYNNFSAGAQYVHKMNEENNIYASITQSFIMPTFAQMYGASDSAIPNPGLKPQTGMNYEIGWKQNHNSHAWRVAIFKTNIKDNISASWDKNKQEYQYTNEDFRNLGIELSCDIASDGPLSYNYGITYQNPEVNSDKKDYWDRKFGKLQLTGGVTYKKSKWVSSLSGSILADRVQTPSAEHSFDAKPYFLTTWNNSYSPDKNSTITLTIDNLFNREDIVSHSSSTYYSTPINYLLTYTYKF